MVMIEKSAKKGKKEEEKKVEDNTLKPTRPSSAYIFFSNEMVPKIKADEGIPHRDAMAKAGKLWQELSEEKKKPYNDKNEEDKQR